MRAILAHAETDVYGNRVTIVLEFDAIKQLDESLCVVPGSTAAYRVSDGTHTITGDDLHAAYLGNVTGLDMLRSLGSFLSADREHINYGHHHDTERCPEYGAGCPMYRAEYVDALDAMGDVLEWVSIDPDDCPIAA